MELSEIAHERLVQAGWEIERFEESDFGKSAITSYNSVAKLSSKRLKTGFGMTLGAAVATVAGAIFTPYTLLASPIALGFACKELFVRMDIAPRNDNLLSIQRRSHYIHRTMSAVDTQLKQIADAAARPEMLKVMQKAQKQWNQFRALVGVLAVTKEDGSTLIEHNKAIASSLADLAKASRGRSKALDSFTKAKAGACDTFVELKKCLVGIFNRAIHNTCIAHQSLHSLIPT
ncbi:MAG: hypothetical protein JSS12_03550 [Verrucomicrobia bacterium]|nr:hypothetical protein [Verrucomicrobiota bacterium]